MIEATIRHEDRARAIGSWSGLGGIAAAIGPFVGGWLVQFASWRWAFFLNIPLAAVTVVLALRTVPETRDEEAGDSFDVLGAVLATASLALVTYALIEYGSLGRRGPSRSFSSVSPSASASSPSSGGRRTPWSSRRCSPAGSSPAPTS